jgi:hypothetical protein
MAQPRFQLDKVPRRPVLVSTYSRPDRMGVTFSGSKRPAADVAMLTRYCRPRQWLFLSLL